MPDPTPDDPTPGKRPLSDDEILLPDREVRLTNRSLVTVRPWGLSKGKIVLERLDQLTPKMFSGGEEGQTWSAREVLSKAYDEMVDLVSLSVDVPREEMEADPRQGGWTFEDLLEVTDAVLEVCVIRSDGRGALPLLLSLIQQMNSVVARSLGPAIAREQAAQIRGGKPPSNGSGNGAPSTARRARGSGSRKKGKRGKG